MATTTSTARRVRLMPAALWTGQALLATQFVMGGLTKLAGSAAMVEMFAEIGGGQWLRTLVGALEVAGAVGLMVPRWRCPAAIGLVGLMAGATLTNVLVLDESPLLPVTFGTVAALVAWGRRHELRDLIRKGVAR